MKKTLIRTFVNKYNKHKFLEVHYDGYGHRTVRQYLYWPATNVKNMTGDGSLHRWHKENLLEILWDYEEVSRKEA